MVDPIRLDARQWEAVAATTDHVLVDAGAGTGKTNTVVGRVLYLLGVPLCGRTIDRAWIVRRAIQHNPAMWDPRGHKRRMPA